MAAGSNSTLLVRPLVAAMGGDHAQEAALLHASSLTPQMVADADARITPAQFCVAWAEAARLAGTPHLALRIAEATPPGAFGIVEYVCRSAPTLGAALAQWVRYLSVLDDAVEVALVEEGDRTSLRVMVESEAPAPASHELCFALVVLHARRLLSSPFRPVAVELEHRARGDVAPYEAFFDAKVTFGARTTQLVMPTAAMDAKLATADPSLLAVLTRAADELLGKSRGAPPIVAQVKRVLWEALREDDADVGNVAKRLGLSPRSLQRRLKDEGASFQGVREEARAELAQRYLDDGLSIAEISFLLGFSQPSAFFRAFKRWTGVTPLESRGARGQPIGAHGD
jgi:AraC-like DNA-binding protein